MTRDDLKNDLQPVIGKLEELEARARKLQNQNLADVIAGAHGKIKQFCEHPDTHLVLESDKPSEPATREEAIERMRMDGDADPEGTARMNWPHLFDLFGNPNASSGSGVRP